MAYAPAYDGGFSRSISRRPSVYSSYGAVPPPGAPYSDPGMYGSDPVSRHFSSKPPRV